MHTISFDCRDGGVETLTVQVGLAIDDFDETGQVLWPGAPILGYFLLSDEGQRLIRGKDVAEVGAGIGIPGLLALRHANSVSLTDHNDTVLKILNTNANLNKVDKDSTIVAASVAKVDWYLPAPSDLIGKFDVVIGADVVYAPEAASFLFATVGRLLSHAQDAKFILSHVSSCRRVDMGRCGSIGICPLFCNGGRQHSSTTSFLFDFVHWNYANRGRVRVPTNRGKLARTLISRSPRYQRTWIQ